MLITRVSIVSGKENTRSIDCTERQIDAWRSGVHIQDAMPQVSAEDREFIMSGITPEEWLEVFSGEDEDGQPTEQQEWHDYDADC